MKIESNKLAGEQKAAKVGNKTPPALPVLVVVVVDVVVVGS